MEYWNIGVFERDERKSLECLRTRGFDFTIVYDFDAAVAGRPTSTPCCVRHLIYTIEISSTFLSKEHTRIPMTNPTSETKEDALSPMWVRGLLAILSLTLILVAAYYAGHYWMWGVGAMIVTCFWSTPVVILFLKPPKVARFICCGTIFAYLGTICVLIFEVFHTAQPVNNTVTYYTFYPLCFVYLLYSIYREIKDFLSIDAT